LQNRGQRRAPEWSTHDVVGGQCDWSAGGLRTGCDERLLPELKSLPGIWRQLGAIAMVYRLYDEDALAKPRPRECDDLIGHLLGGVYFL